MSSDIDCASFSSARPACVAVLAADVRLVGVSTGATDTAPGCHAIALHEAMARVCTVCAHPARQSIDDALTGGGVGSVLAGRFGLSTHALSRHRRAHVAGVGSGGQPPAPPVLAARPWVPAFPGQRPPFLPGHELSLQHGAYSPRKVDPLAAEMVALILADPDCQYAHGPTYRPALWAWSRAEAQAQLLTEYLAARGEESGDSIGDLDSERVRAAYLLLHRADARAATGRARLGLDPLSRARLGRDVAAGSVDAARLMAILAEQEAAAEDVDA